MSLRVMRIVIQKVEIPGSWLMMLIKEDILYMNLYYIYIYHDCFVDCFNCFCFFSKFYL